MRNIFYLRTTQRDKKMRYRGTDAGVISDFFAVERHIQVAADEHLAREEGRKTKARVKK